MENVSVLRRGRLKSTEFTILNTEFTILNTEPIFFNTEFINLNAKSFVFNTLPAPPASRQRRRSLCSACRSVLSFCLLKRSQPGCFRRRLTEPTSKSVSRHPWKSGCDSGGFAFVSAVFLEVRVTSQVTVEALLARQRRSLRGFPRT